MDNLLVAQMRQEGRRRQAHCLVVSSKSLLELRHQPREEQRADLGQLRVDDGRHGRVDGREGQARGLRLHDAAAEQAAAAHQVLAEELGHDVLDVGHVDLVDEPVDRLLERLPGHALVLLARLVRDLRLQGAQAGGRNVRAAGARGEKLVVLGLGGGLLFLLGGRRRGHLGPHERPRGRRAAPSVIEAIAICSRGAVGVAVRGCAASR